jgi:hypothetical protein
VGEPVPPPRRRRGGLSWLSVGEAAAVIAVVIAALSYWDAHREHAAAASQSAAEARAHAAFVMVGSADARGGEIALRALSSNQAIQSLHLVFPAAIRGDPVDIVAARPRIQADWIAPGLERALDGAHAKGDGEGRLPLAVVTTYAEGCDTLTDTALYAIGYAWRSRFLRGRQIALQGISLVRRGLKGDPRAAVDRLWARDERAMEGKPK